MATPRPKADSSLDAGFLSKHVDRQVVRRVFSSFHKEKIRDDVVDHWVAEVTGGRRTLQDLVSSLQSELDRYHDLRSRFHEVYASLVGDRHGDRAFVDLWRTCEHIADEMTSHVRLSPAFADRCREVIARTCVGTNAEVERLLVQMQEGTLPCTEEAIIKALGLGETSDGSRATLPVTAEVVVPADAPEVDKTVHPHKDVPASFPGTATLQAFREVFGRCLTVTELMKYSCQRLCTREQLEELHAFHLKYFQKIVALHRAYVACECSEDQFLAEALPVLQYTGDGDKDDSVNARLLERMKTDFVANDARYHESLVMRLDNLSRSLYDHGLSDNERRHAVACARARCMELDGDELRKLLVSLRQEFHELADRVVAVFQRVLSREPDPLELDQGVHEFRCQGDPSVSYEGMDDDLVRRLLMSLEHHDVIKAKLRAAYEKLHGCLPAGSWVYTGLSEVLEARPQDEREVERTIEVVVGGEATIPEPEIKAVRPTSNIE
jgi:hypothetical protein